jgi:hypothetical protein
MTTQLSFDDIKVRRFPDVAQHVEEAFLEFHRANPRIYELFKFFATEAKTRWNKFGVGAVWERMRWESSADPIGGGFKCNNSYRSCYARLLIQEHPEFKNFFELRHSSRMEVH